MGRPTLRPRNVCRDCGYGWYPRGNNVARRCPNCGSGRVRLSYAGCVATLAVIAMVSWCWWSSPRDGGSSSSRQTPGARAPTASVTASGSLSGSPRHAERAASLCGSADAIVARVGDWSEWSCQSEDEAGPRWGECLSRAEYASDRGQGCPGAERCCPPPAAQPPELAPEEPATPPSDPEAAAEPPRLHFLIDRYVRE